MPKVCEACQLGRQVRYPTMLSHEHVNMIEFFFKYYNDMDNIFLEYFLPHKI